MIQRESNMTGLVSMASPTVKTSIQANTASTSAREEGPTPTPQVMQAASATSSTCSSVERGEAEAAST